VWIQARDADAWACQRITPRQISRKNSDRFFETARIDFPGNVAQRHVRGCQGNSQAATNEHHHDAVGSGSLGQKLCMAGKPDPCCVDDAFVHRPRDQRIKCSVQATVCRALKGLQHISTIARV